MTGSCVWLKTNCITSSRGFSEVVRETITALGMVGPTAKDAIPTLEKLTEHDDPQIAERAKAALRQVSRSQ